VTLEDSTPLTKHQERRQQRLGVLDDCAGDCRAAAVEAQKRGLYSAKTNLSDIEAAMMRTKAKRTRQLRTDGGYQSASIFVSINSSNT
jgi:hypothetical protein